MRNISEKRCRENQNTHLVFSNFIENRAVYEIMKKSMEQPDGNAVHNILRRIRCACWITKAKM
jgi:hypothetical protein